MRKLPLLSVLLLSVTVTAIVTTGCSDGKFDDAEVFGVWTATEDSRTEEARIAGITFLSNGKFTATNLPLRIIIDPVEIEPIGSGQGKWTLTNAKSGWDILLSFDQLGDRTNGFATPIHVSGRNVRERRLFFWVGEAGEDRFQFVRENALPPAR